MRAETSIPIASLIDYHAPVANISVNYAASMSAALARPAYSELRCNHNA